MSKKRTSGTGWLERKGTKYLARWMVDGKRFSRATGTSDRRTAERMLDEWTRPFRLKTEADRYDFFAAKAGGVKREIERLRNELPGLLVANSWEAYESAPERPDTTGEGELIAYEARWGKFVKWLAVKHPEAMEMRQITRDMAAEYLKAVIATGVGACYYNKTLRNFKRIWSVLALNEENKMPEKSPFENMATRREDTKARRALSEEEVRKVSEAVTGEMRVLFAIGLYTGLRLGDACQLSWETVDMTNGIITVTPAKTAKKSGAIVRIPIHPVLYAILSETDERKRIGAVMPKTDADYKKWPTKVSEGVCKIFKKCGIETQQEAEGCKRKRTLVSFHSLRHTFVSMSANAGTPLAIVRRLVGHVSEKMTQRYFHESEDAMQAAVAAIPRLLSGGGIMGGQEQENAPTGLVASLYAIAKRMTSEQLSEAIKRLEQLKRERDGECATEVIEA